MLERTYRGSRSCRIVCINAWLMWWQFLQSWLLLSLWIISHFHCRPTEDAVFCASAVIPYSWRNIPACLEDGVKVQVQLWYLAPTTHRVFSQWPNNGSLAVLRLEPQAFWIKIFYFQDAEFTITYRFPSVAAAKGQRSQWGNFVWVFENTCSWSLVAYCQRSDP